MGVKINKDKLNSPARSKIVADITTAVQKFETATNNIAHLSGLPLIRTVIADRIQKEMKFFLFGSLILSVLILLLFFRSINTTLLSLAVVIIGVIWTSCNHLSLRLQYNVIDGIDAIAGGCDRYSKLYLFY